MEYLYIKCDTVDDTRQHKWAIYVDTLSGDTIKYLPHSKYIKQSKFMINPWNKILLNHSCKVSIQCNSKLWHIISALIIGVFYDFIWNKNIAIEIYGTCSKKHAFINKTAPIQNRHKSL